MWSVHRGNPKRVVLVCIQTISTQKFSHFARSAQDLDHPNPFLFICLLLRIGALNSTILKPRSTDTSLLRTVCFVPGETKPRHQFSLLKFNPLNTDPPFVRTLFMVPSILVLTGFDCRNWWKIFISNLDNTVDWIQCPSSAHRSNAMQPVERFSPLSRESGSEIREVRSPGKWNLESGIHWKMIRNPVTGICKSWRGIQNPRLSWIPLHGAIFQCLVLSLGWSNSKKAAFLA